ncbi:MAG: hypothetical protein NTV11_19990 [Rhodocyclales bacterium]|nr:hypothetical protein [Rhodocyclales bacterium]
MNEYMLFDASLRDRFVKFAADLGLVSEIRPDQIEGFVIALPDDLPDDIEEAIEGKYEELMADQVSLMESEGDSSGRFLMRVTATLADGSPRIVQLPAVYARRLFEHFSVEEIQELVSAIAQSAMNPAEGPMCLKASGSQTPPETGASSTPGDTQ